ncbi:MAG TPA: CHAT domain-containing protein, partial [Lysobacter sp.]|nr:CHAT domain-containing protein [Lysobacter sp.]
DQALQTYGNGLALLGEAIPGEAEQLTSCRAFIQDCAANVYAAGKQWSQAAQLRAKAFFALTAVGRAHLLRDTIIVGANLVNDRTQLGDLEGAGEVLGRVRDELHHLPDDLECAGTVAMTTAQWLNVCLRQTHSDTQRATLLKQSRAEHARAITCYRLVENRLKVAYMQLSLAEIELELGDTAQAALALRQADKLLPGEDAYVDEGQLALRRELDALRFRHFHLTAPPELRDVLPSELVDRPGVRISMADSPSIPAPPVRPSQLNAPNPDQFLPFAWRHVDRQRAVLEVEKQKSAALLRLMRHHHREGDEAILAALERLEHQSDDIPVRPQDVGKVHEAFIDYYLGDNRSIAFLEFPNQPIRSFDLDVGRDEIAASVQRLRKSFDGGGMRMPILPDRPWSVKLDFIDQIGGRLLPFLDELRQANLICFFAHGPLHGFPLHAVCGPDGMPIIRHSAVAYNLSRRSLAVARSANRSRPGCPARPRSALCVAVPAVGEHKPELFAGEADLLASLGLEVLPLDNADATVSRVLDKFGRFDLVHFNCHGLFSATAPLDSALLMSNGIEGPRRAHQHTEDEQAKYLTARLLFQQHVVTDTVVLRACSSGVTKVRAGDEHEGLLRGLMHMGVATCLVARWKIDLTSSRELLSAFYRMWLTDEQPRPKAMALQQAQLALLDHECDHYHHPFHWAPFTLTGDWW